MIILVPMMAIQHQKGTSMLRLGAPPSQSREMDLDDLFTARLQLMIIMAQAYLDDYPMGYYRRRAMYKNARLVEAECIDIGKMDPPNTDSKNPLHERPGKPRYGRLFYLRAKLVAVMIKAASREYPLDENRKAELREHISLICKAMNFTDGAGCGKILKVA
jgi:hypothetical protein